jgi:hypothetical protein
MSCHLLAQHRVNTVARLSAELNTVSWHHRPIHQEHQFTGEELQVKFSEAFF